MTTPFDYDTDPERFRLAIRMTRRHLTTLVAATASRHDSPELAAAAAERVATPVAITKRGALLYARK